MYWIAFVLIVGRGQSGIVRPSGSGQADCFGLGIRGAWFARMAFGDWGLPNGGIVLFRIWPVDRKLVVAMRVVSENRRNLAQLAVNEWRGRTGRSKSMDIFCCGMYRSCSTWQYEVAIEILRHARHQGDPVEVLPIGYRTGPDYDRESPARPDRSSIRIMKAHEGHPSFTRAIDLDSGLGLYAHRDARDVIFSLMYKRQQSFREIVRTGMIHQVLVNDRFWRSQRNVLVQRYDDIMARPERSIVEIAAFLGVVLPKGEAACIAAAYSREANLKRTRETRQALSSKGVDPKAEDAAEVYDPRTLLHWNHIRPEARGWRDLATVQERALMHRMLGAWLAENGYPADEMAGEFVDPSVSKTWRADSVHGLFRCHSREISARYYRVAVPVKRMLGMGKAERRSKSIDMA